MADLGIDRLLEQAETLAGAWGARARASTTLGQERALLRLFGVSGLDRAGRPLAGAAVDRWLGQRPRTAWAAVSPCRSRWPCSSTTSNRCSWPWTWRPARSTSRSRRSSCGSPIGGPSPRPRRAGWPALAIDRIDADRVARRELLDLLGDARRPWLGTTPVRARSRRRARRGGRSRRGGLRPAAGRGADRSRARRPDCTTPAWTCRSGGRGGIASARRADGSPGAAVSIDGELAPTGSQRALARLRRVADGVAAERRELRPARDGDPAPRRARRGGRRGLRAGRHRRGRSDGGDRGRRRGPGSVAGRPRLRPAPPPTGRHVSWPSVPGPSSWRRTWRRASRRIPATRAGRALALQLLGRRTGAGRRHRRATASSSVPTRAGWPRSRRPRRGSLAEVDLRRRLFPDQILRFDEPAGPVAESAASLRWPHLVGAALARAGDGLDDHAQPGEDARRAALDGRVIATTAGDVAAASPRRSGLHGVGRGACRGRDRRRHGRRSIGWPSSAGGQWSATAGPDGSRSMGGDAVAERTEAFDPLAVLERDGD